MFAVERLGSYITRGVNTVSGPFHPFGGAVDIVVVEQQDGSFKSSPWYIRFGKFQGVLKAKEKVVNISVDGVEANFHMYLDHKGVAYFLREVDAEEVDCMLSPQSSGEETDGQCSDRRPMKSKSCNYDADRSSSVTQIDLSNGKAVARTSSRRSRILGLVFGRKSMKEERVRVEEDGAGVVRDDSMERAEMAADLLEVKWSTNIPSGRGKNENSSRFQGISDGEADKDSHINDGEDQVNLLMHDNNINNLENSVTHEDFSQSSFQKLDSSVEATGVEMSHVIMGASILGESGFEGNISLNSETSRETKELGVSNADRDENAKGVKSEIAFPNSQNPDSSMLEACTSKKLEKEHDYGDVNGGLSDNDDSKAENGSDRLQSFIHCDCSESSSIGLDGFSEQANETVYLSCEKYEEDLVHTETLHETTEQIYEVNSQLETSILVAKETLNVLAVLGDENSRNSSSDSMILENETISINTNSIVTETYSEMVTVHPINGSAEEVESCSVFTISSFSNRVCVVRDEKSTSEEDEMNNLRPSLEPVGDSQEVTSDFVPNEAINNSPSEVPEEEQFLFNDLDDFKLEEVKCMDSIYLASKGTEGVNEAFSSNLESDSSPDKFVLEKLPNDVEETAESKIRSSHINIPRNSKVAAQEVGCMADSLPNMWSHFDELDSNHYHGRFLGRSLDSNSEPSKWMLMRKDVASYIKSYGDEEHGLSNSQPLIEDSQLSDELKNLPRSPVVGDPSKIIDASPGSWRLWPFKRSRSMETAKSALICTTDLNAENVLETSVMDPEKDVPNIAENVLETSVMDPEKDVPNNAENVLDSTNGMVAEKDVPNPKANKKKIRALSPTSEQLASLNLKEGRNTITFTFSTSMLGKQQVDARIYLWRWDTRIVISDVDGTITKSDLLGQFMPLVGKDWSQTGVAHLFSAIKENGYQMLFLSARAISQAYHTRQFLFNLKQDGKALPDGPVVISPDGLFPSLFREVIRRAPHEFKISCLEDIRALFPSDRNPFYAGFGNRDTDEFSYLKVGIPKGKIFIINPKGEVVVNRRVDSKSYTSLQVLVNGMFPPVSSFEREDYNSWNFWKLPPPAIDI